jgi:HPr kinase/phosphorylase
MLVQATALAHEGRAILLIGPSQSGKSDLALRLIEADFALIADDTVLIEPNSSWIAARPSPTVPPRLSIRGIGNCALPLVASAPVSLVMRMAHAHLAETVPKLSLAGPWHGCYVPSIDLYPFEGSALIKTRLALHRFGL